MSLKSKLITTISMFVLVLVMTIVGVFAVTSATVNMGGNITFVADDVYARITGKIEGANEPTNLAVLNYTATSKPRAEELSTWINNLTFKSATESIKITVTVENLAQDRWLLVNIEDKITSPIANLIRKMEKGGQAYTSGTNHALAPSTGEGTSKVEFVLTLSVENGNYSITDASYDYIIHLNNSNEEPEQPAEELEFTFDGNKVTGYTGTETNIRIPSSYSIQETEATEFIVTLADFSGGTPEGRNKVGILMALSGYTLHLSNGNTIVCNNGFQDINGNINMISSNLPMTVDLTGVDLTFTVGAEGPTQGQEQALGGFLQGYWYKQATDSDWVDSSVTPLPETLNYPVEFKVNIKTYKFFEGEDNSVTEIGDNAFSGLLNLESIIIPEGITKIGEFAFGGSMNLSYISLPNTLTTIGQWAFMECYSLHSITLPENFQTIEGEQKLSNYISMVYNNSNLDVSSYFSPEVLEIINKGEQAEGRIETTNGVKYYINETKNQKLAIGPENNRNSLTTLSIDEGTTGIAPNAFAYTTLSSIILPNTLEYIYSFAFASSSLNSVVIPDNVINIQSGAFQYCNNLVEVTIGRSVEYIAWGNGPFNTEAFGLCYSLAIVYNKSSNVSFEIGGSNYGAVNLKEVVEAGSAQGRIETENNFNYYVNDVTGVFIALSPSVPREGLTEVVLSDRTTHINPYAFYCNNRVFLNKNNHSISEIVIPSSVIEIGENAFEYCNSLKIVTFESNSKIETIKDNAFTNCQFLESITIDKVTPPTLGNSVFPSYVAGEMAIYVPSASVEAYQTAWSSYADKIKPIP